MDLLEFKKCLRKRYGITIYLNYALATMGVIGGVVLFFVQPAYAAPMFFVYKLILSSFLIMIGVYAINATRNTDQPTIGTNQLSKKQNIIVLEMLMKHYDRTPGLSDPDHQQFIQKRKWWQSDISVHAFAGEKMVAIKATSQPLGGGIVDFGVANRFERKIVKVVRMLAKEKFPDQDYDRVR